MPKLYLVIAITILSHNEPIPANSEAIGEIFIL